MNGRKTKNNKTKISQKSTAKFKILATNVYDILAYNKWYTTNTHSIESTLYVINLVHM